MNPKNYHIELRRNTSVQEILLEDDIFAPTEEQVVEYLQAWATCYLRCQDEPEPLVILATHNWTEETVYQNTFGCFQHSLCFNSIEEAKDALEKIFRMGWNRNYDILSLKTEQELDEGTQAKLLEDHRPWSYSFNQFVAEPFNEPIAVFAECVPHGPLERIEEE